jgi:hypothetical protein
LAHPWYNCVDRRAKGTIDNLRGRLKNTVADGLTNRENAFPIVDVLRAQRKQLAASDIRNSRQTDHRSRKNGPSLQERASLLRGQCPFRLPTVLEHRQNVQNSSTLETVGAVARFRNTEPPPRFRCARRREAIVELVYPSVEISSEPNNWIASSVRFKTPSVGHLCG